MKRLPLLLLCVSACIGCGTSVTNSDSQDSIDTMDSIQDISRMTTNNPDKIIDSLRTQALIIFEEPDFQDTGGESYRFIFFDHNKPQVNHWKIYRVFENEGKYYSIRKWHEFINGENPTLMADSALISHNEWIEIGNLINGSYFWSLETVHLAPVGLTDDLWILEGRHNNSHFTANKSYHFVLRWNPYEGSFKSACLKIQEICER